MSVLPDDAKSAARAILPASVPVLRPGGQTVHDGWPDGWANSAGSPDRGPGPEKIDPAPGLIVSPAAHPGVASPDSGGPGWPGARPGFAAASPGTLSKSCPETAGNRGTLPGTPPAPHRKHRPCPASAGRFAPAPAPRGRPDTLPAVDPTPGPLPP